MENTDGKRNNEVVTMPRSLDEACKMLNRIESLQDKFTINSSDGKMSGNIDDGFLYNP